MSKFPVLLRQIARFALLKKHLQDWEIWQFLQIFFTFLCLSAHPAHATQSANSLVNNPSPYLAMHAHDPVHWQVWSKAVLEQAQKEQKLILLSSGYFACHWCHVMQRENYQNPEIAQFLNQHYIAVKIDRELSPDLDAYLIHFAEQATGKAGWPQHVILTPQGYPVIAFTYQPPKTFLKTLQKVATYWQQHPQKMIQLAQAFIPPPQPLINQPLTLTTSTFQQALLKQLELAKDDLSGGIGSSKFPNEPLLTVLLQQPTLPEEVEDWLQLTLKQMRTQHLQDHINGGFFRYTIDPNWQTPHFEKMLYNQAQLISVYLLNFQRHHQLIDLQTALNTYRYTLEHLWNPKAQLFQSSESAIDLQGKEGGQYLFTKAELKKRLPPKRYAKVIKAWHLNQPSPFEAGWLPTPEGLSIQDWQAIQAALKTPAAKIPHDSKSILGWNALMLEALYYLNATLQTTPKINPLLKTQVAQQTQTLQNRLLKLIQQPHPPRAISQDNQPMGEATLQDYAMLAKALYTLHNLPIQIPLAPLEENLAPTPEEWLGFLQNRAEKQFLTPTGWRLSQAPLLPGQHGKWVIPDDALPSATTPFQCPHPEQLAQVQNDLLDMPIQTPSVLTVLHCLKR